MNWVFASRRFNWTSRITKNKVFLSYLCEVSTMDRPPFMTVIKESHRKRRATGSIPVVGSSFSDKKKFTSTKWPRGKPLWPIEDITGGRLHTVKQRKTVWVPSLLFLSAKKLSAFAGTLPRQSAHFAHPGKKSFYPEGRWARMFRSLYMWTAWVINSGCGCPGLLWQCFIQKIYSNNLNGKQFHSPKIQLEGYQPTQWQCWVFVCFHRCELKTVQCIL